MEIYKVKNKKAAEDLVLLMATRDDFEFGDNYIIFHTTFWWRHPNDMTYRQNCRERVEWPATS